METVIEKECGALGGLFQAVMNDMKVSYPIWEDFISRASKLHSQLRTTLTAAGAFLEAFQKVADMATNTRGATREIGSALTRMCMRHRSIETKLAHFTQALSSNLLGPLQEKLEEWKKTAAQLDKDHAKEYKKARQEIKKKSTDTIRLQKKAKKVEIIGNREVQPALDSALQEVTDTYLLLQEEEKQAVRRALLEERSRYCTFTFMLRDVLTHEVAMLGDVTHLQAILDDLSSLTKDPHVLPPASEQLILDLKGSDYNWSYQTPPSSPSTSGSRKSSMCSSLNSVTSSDSRSSGSHAHSPSAHYRAGGLAPPAQAPLRLSSVSSDSGFTSQDTVYSKPPSPMFGQLAQKPMSLVSESSASEGSLPPSALPQQLSYHDPRSSHSACFSFPPPPCDTLLVTNHRPTPHPSSPARASHPHNPTANKHPPPRLDDSPPLSPLPLSSQVPSWKDWVKPGPYDLQVANTLTRRSDPHERPMPMAVPAEMAAPPTPGVSVVPTMPGPAYKAPGDMARAMLAQSLLSGSQKSSQETLPCSSGYGSQASTPRSDDSISMHGGDYGCYSMNGEMERASQSDYDKCATISRSSDIARAYRHMFQNKRGASVSSVADSAAAAGLAACGVATIRRTPTLRRTASSGGPIPIQTPVIPVVRCPVVPPPHGGAAAGCGRGGGGGGNSGGARGSREQQHDGGGGSLMSPKHGILPARAGASSRSGSEERMDGSGSPRHAVPAGRSWSRSGSEEALERNLSPKHSTPSSSTPGTPGTSGPYSWHSGGGGSGVGSRSGSEERLEERSLSPRRGSQGPARGGWPAGPPPTLMKPSAAVIAAAQGGGGSGGLQRAGSQGSYYAQVEEEQRMAQNYQSIAEKLEALTAGAHALAEEQFPPSVPPPDALACGLPEETDTLGTIRRGVRLRQTGPRSDRSAPMFAYYALLQGEKRIK